MILIIGNQDFQVDNHNSIFYYKRLKAFNKNVELHVLNKDDHSLDLPKSKILINFLALKNFLTNS